MTNQQTDVIIVGGGVIGLSAAAFLLQQGRSVTIVEKNEVGSGSSYGNCGLITPSHVAPLTMPGTFRKAWSMALNPRSPLFIKPTLNPGRLGWFLRTARKCNQKDALEAMKARAAILGSSRRLFSSLIAEHKLDCEWEEQGLLVAYKSREALEEENTVDILLRQHGVTVDILDGGEVQKMEPAFRSDVVGARYYPRDAHLRPDRFVSELLRVVKDLGARVMEQCAVEQFQIAGQAVQSIKTAHGDLRAAEYVLATGAWTPKLTKQLGLSIPIQPGKGYTVTMDRPAVCPSIPAILGEKNMAVTPWESGYRLGGTMEFSGYNRALNSTRIDAILEGAGEYLREPTGKGQVEYWTGWRPMSFDELPFIGRAKRTSNLTVAAGHGMLGVTMGPATGKLVSEIVTRSPTHIDAEPFRLDRV